MEWKCGNCHTNTMANSASGSHPSMFNDEPRTAAHPSTGGMAPGNAPMNVQIGDSRFSGVYAPRYAADVATARLAVSRFDPQARYANPASMVAIPNTVAWVALMRPAGRGRRLVRCM